MQFLRANTAVDVLIGPFVDVTDGSTAETGLTLDVELSKLGQALANKNDATGPVHDAAGTIDGHYNCELDATDTDTEGTLVLLAFDSAALIVRHEYMVLAEAAWDSMFVAKDTGFMDVNVKPISEDTAAADNLESACDNYSVTRGLTGTALPAAAADAAGGVAISTAGSLDIDATDANVTLILEDTGTTIPATITTIDNEIATLQTDSTLIVEDTSTTIPASLTTIDNEIATIDGIVDNILIDTNELQTDWTNAGRLDAILDTILVVTLSIPALIGRVDDTAAAGDPTSVDNLFEYIKQIVNILVGSDGIVTMPSAAAPANGISIAEMIRAIYDDTNSLDGTKIPNTISLANINVEVDTALRTTTDGEPAQGTPGASISIEEKISWLYKAWRNKTTSTATQYNLYDDDTTTIGTKATLADDATTASRTEMVTGP